MTRAFRPPFAAFLALAPLPVAALTPDEAWQAMQDAAGEGVTITAASESSAGGTLTVEGIEIRFEDSSTEDVTTTTVALVDRMTFADAGGGAVGIGLPEGIPVTVTTTTPDGDGGVSFDVTQTGLVLTASGTPDAIAYDYAADTLSLVLGEIVSPPPEDGEEAQEFDLTGEMTLTAVSGQTTGEEGAGSFAADLLSLDVSGSEAETPGSFALTASAENVTSDSTGGVGIFAGPEAMVALLESDETLTSSLGYGPFTYEITVEDPESGDMRITGGADRSGVTATLGDGGIDYTGGTEGGRFALSGSAIPLPEVTAEMERSEWAFRMPLAETEAAQPFGLTLGFDGLTIGEGVWSMFDPAGQLSRDPASLKLALSGLGRWDVNIFAPDADAQITGGTPGEVESLSIDEIALDLLGVVLDGSGAFTFATGADGVPVPEGSISLTLTGAEDLIDTLVQMGVVPEDQATGARMMLGLFATPGDEPDTLTSDIEFGADGSITANGQRLR